jgi:hypothetical protein
MMVTELAALKAQAQFEQMLDLIRQAAEEETGTNRGLRDRLFDRSGIGLHAGIPALERGP